MRWNVLENSPPLVGTGARLTVDGDEVIGVRAFDTEEGWAEILCPGCGDHEGPHMDPDDPGEACTRILEGAVVLHRDG